jgi:hypothetical protein
VVAAPFKMHVGFEDLAAAPLAAEVVHKTFCGT